MTYLSYFADLPPMKSGNYDNPEISGNRSLKLISGGLLRGSNDDFWLPNTFRIGRSSRTWKYSYNPPVPQTVPFCILYRNTKTHSSPICWLDVLEGCYSFAKIKSENLAIISFGRKTLKFAIKILPSWKLLFPEKCKQWILVEKSYEIL